MSANHINQYVNTPPINWLDHFARWVYQFEDKEERALATKMAAKLLFIPIDRYQELQKFVYSELKGYVEVELNLKEIDFLDTTLFFPVDGSGEVHLIDFLRINKIPGRKDRIKGRLYIDDPDEILHYVMELEKLKELMAVVETLQIETDQKYREDLWQILEFYKKFLYMSLELKKSKFEKRKYLCIVTDFIGTGGTITKDIKRLLEYYGDSFEKIFILAYIATQYGLERVESLRNDYEKLENVICGLEISNYLRVFDENNSNFEVDEKRKIQLMCEKYFNRFRHPDIQQWGEEITYGYKGNVSSKGNAQLLVIYTNIPNNTLPLLWAGNYKYYNPEWIALFERIPSYSYHLIGGRSNGT